jgi:hypothetical protein
MRVLSERARKEQEQLDKRVEDINLARSLILDLRIVCAKYVYCYEIRFFF